MASYNTVITNEGAALLASVIANQGTLTFSEMRFSTTDYDGVEATLTVGTFAGVFITAAASASVVDSTTIKVDAQFDNSGIVGDHPLYSIGIVGTDGNTTALIAVCTTTNPDIIRAALTGVSTYAFNVNLTVSSTSNITVTGTTAAVLYDTDIVNTLNSTDATDPLSANMGHTLGEEVNAIVNVYGAKNLIPYPYYETTKSENGITFTDNGDGTVTVSDTSSADTYYAMHSAYKKYRPAVGTYIFSKGENNQLAHVWVNAYNGTTYVRQLANLVADESYQFSIDYSDYDRVDMGIYIPNGTVISTPITIYPMLRDARIVDPTYEPYAETNQQLTINKANRSDLASLNLTGTKNTSGATITAGTYFYLNGRYCIAIQDIGNNADFTENTNYKVTSVGEGWQVESVAECIPDTGCSFTGIASGDRLRVVRFKNGMKMLSGLITVDDPALIQNEYLAALPSDYEYKSSATQYNIWTTFVSYNGNPAIVGVINGTQHVVHWFPVPVASGYCVSPTLFY